MLSSHHCPQCGDSYPPGVYLCPNDQTPHPDAQSEEVVVPTRVDIKIPFAADSSKNNLQANPNETNKEGKSAPLVAQFLVEPGTVIGEYVIETKLGQGGMGEIWRAVHPLIGKQVAIKILRGKIASEEDSVERFIREAKAVNAIKHRALVDIFSFGDLPDGRPYFVMEFLQGRSLLAHISESGPLSWSEIIAIFTQLCEALQATHEQGIIHRDLKSENLFLVQEPNKPFTVKVLDFGLAKLIDSDQENAQLTQDGVVFGTPSYMAPEQCKGNTSALSDIYSLGIILFECITGRTPFAEPGMKAAEVMLRQVGDPAPEPSSMVSGRSVPRSVDSLVLSILEKAPEDRPQNCLELLQKIQSVLEPLAKSESALEPKTAKPVFLPEPVLRRKRRGSGRSLVLALGAAVVVLLGVVLGLSLKEPEPSPQPVLVLSNSQPVSQAMSTSTISEPKTVTVSIDSNPEGATVLFDGVEVGKTPFDREMPYGETEIMVAVEKSGYQPFQKEITPSSRYDWLLSLERDGSKKKSGLLDTNKEPAKDPKPEKIKRPPENKDDLVDDPFKTPKK
jgi:serine/threonine protein kinase